MESGWYFDPNDESARQKFWNGEDWTGETRSSPPSKFPMTAIRPVVSLGLGALAVLLFLGVLAAVKQPSGSDVGLDLGVELALTALVFVGVSWVSLFVWSKKASRKQSLSALLEQRDSGNIDEAGYQTVKDRILG